jgi:hypothetical protein
MMSILIIRMVIWGGEAFLSSVLGIVIGEEDLKGYVVKPKASQLSDSNSQNFLANLFL